jgi:ATP-binding cassette subfamily B protein
MNAIKLIQPYFKKNQGIIITGLCCLIIVDFLQLFIPRIIKWVVDDIAAFQIDMKGLMVYALYIVASGIMIGIFRYIWRRCLIGTSRKVEEGLRNTLFSHIQTLPAAYFDRTKTGDLMAHATNDIMNIRMAVGMGMVALTDAIVLGIASVGFMAYINVRLTLLVLIPMPLLVLSSRFYTRKMHRMYREVQGAFSNLTEVVRERFSGIRIIKTFNMEQDSFSKVEVVSRDYFKKNMSLVKVVGSFFPMMLFFTNVSLAIVLYVGGRQTIALAITPGDFVAFISYLGLLTWPMMATGWVANLIQRGKASLNRINTILLTRPVIEDGAGVIFVKNLAGKVVFENVSFSFNQETLPVLSEVNIELECGSMLGIVGPPGSGKTALLNLIPRIYNVSQGRILIDSNDVSQVRIRDLRSCVSFVSQEPFLFAGTVRENLIFGDKEVPESVLIQAVKDAALYETIQSFPDGFETLVGEKGVVLSGGQKQRIALARAFLHDTPILILDDPISQLDMDTGTSIIKTIRAMAGQKTIVIASHRLSAVRFADNIIVLNDGRILESGTHDQLMKNETYYAKIFRLQELEEEMHAL